MDIRIKEPLYILHNGQDYVVRQGTVGVERKKVVYFYDVTRTVAVGYSRDFCLEATSLFQVSRNITDREVPVRDVIKAVESLEIPADIRDGIISIVNTL